MRPLRLTISAFGPYAGQEIVDFGPALDAGIFGIYGPTGAGKSSIFAAISFALFGKLPNAGQDSKTVRSDHAAPDLMTHVELVFDLGAKRYLIKRRPEQLRPSKRGGGETTETHHAAFFDVTGLSLADIDDGQTGTVIAERKLSDVDPEIQSLLGYGPEQFRQIILLPQGEFETFLKAKTKDRMDVLRQLFDVSIYRRFAETLKDQANAAEKDIKAGRAAVAARLTQEGYETREAISDAISVEQDLCERSAQEAAEAQKASQDALAQLNSARETETLFIDQDQAHRGLAELIARTDEIATLRDDYARLGAVARVIPFDDARDAAQSLRTNAMDQIDVSARQVTEAEVAYAASKLALQSLTDKTPAREAWQNDRLRLTQYQTALGDAAPLELAVADAKRTATTAEAKLETATQAHDRAVAAIETGQTLLDLAREQQEKRRIYEAELRQANDLAKAAEAHTAAQAKVRKWTESQDQTATHLEAAIAATAAADRSLSEAEMALSAVQAVHLATKLSDGAPCPVCGSHDHPTPARGNAESAGLNAAFEQARDARTAILQAENTAREQNTSAKAHLQSAKDLLETLAVPSPDFTDTRGDITTKIETLGPAPDLDVLGAEITQNQQAAQGAASDLEQSRHADQAARIAYTSAQVAHDSALAQLPEGLKTGREINAALGSIDAKITAYDAALQSGQTKERAAHDQQVSAKKFHALSLSAAEDAKAKSTVAQSKFDTALAEAGITSDQFKLGRPDVPKRDALGAEITDFDTRRTVAITQVERADHAVKNHERPDISHFDTTYQAKDAAVRDAISAKAKQDARLGQLASLKASIDAEIAKFAQAEHAIAPLLAVAQTSNGANPAKLTLETYAIAAMFDQVLVSANLRLRPMSGGQYTLMRDTRAPKGGAKQGLDIVVHDTHTGRERDVATLSGGETFMAALSLALGLADVVQTVSGGIHLDTIFIDEGFGSLDATTLDQALQTLQDLVGDNRAIGLISHVDLVKDTIRAGFDITKSNGGSNIRARD